MSFSRYNRSKPSHLLRIPSSPTPYAPVISSPLASRCHRSSSPVSYSSSSYDPAQISSPPPGGHMPLSDLPEPEPVSEENEMQIDVPLPQNLQSHLGQPSIGNFHPSASSSPGPSWLPTLAPPTEMKLAVRPNVATSGDHTHHLTHRSAGFKKPNLSSRHSPPSAGHGGPPSSSPTPFSKLRTRTDHVSPSQSRQRAAGRIRSAQRSGMLSSRRLLLDAFVAGGPDTEVDLTAQEQAIMEAICRKDHQNANQRLRRALSEEQFGTDELIQEEEDVRAQNYDSSLVEDDVDPSEIFAAYQKDDSHIDIDYLATEHQEGQWGCRRSLCSLLTSPPATCPACRKSGLAVTDRRPPDVQCLSCHWGLSSEILTALEQEFITHGPQPVHLPVIAHDQHVGTTVTCSHAACDMILAV